jgi:multisubunit Na+/H+ antiporter MnhB subunit
MVFVAGLGIVAAGWKRPGVALLCGLSVGAAVILLLAITSGHYLRHVPTGERHWWMYLVFVGASAITLGLAATVLKARKLNRIYRHALDTPHLDG